MKEIREKLKGKVEEFKNDFASVGLDNMDIFADWLVSFYASVNEEEAKESYNKIYGFIWGLSSCGKISVETRIRIINKLIDEMYS